MKRTEILQEARAINVVCWGDLICDSVIINWCEQMME